MGAGKRCGSLPGEVDPRKLLPERRQACNYLKAALCAAAQIKGGFIGNQARPHLSELSARIKYSSLYFALQSAVRSTRLSLGDSPWRSLARAASWAIYLAFSGPRCGQNISIEKCPSRSCEGL